MFNSKLIFQKFDEQNKTLNQQNDLIKRQNKRLRKIQDSVQCLNDKLATLSELIYPSKTDDPANGAFEAATKLRELQSDMDASIVGTIVDKPRTD
jgi:uncharacterized coiled-coil protein SlyX